MVMMAIRFLVVWAVATIVAVPLLLILVVLIPFRIRRLQLVNWSGACLASIVLWIFGARTEIEGRAHLDSTGPAIYVANHSSSLDTVLVPWMGVMRSVFVLKREALWIPLLGQILWLSGHLMINRGSAVKSMSALNELADFVTQNRLGVWIMPEGTRSKTGHLGRFKGGFVHLAMATGYPVIPIAICGAKSIWPNGTWFLRPGEVHIHVFPPVDTLAWSGDSVREHAEEIRGIIATRLNR